MKNASRSEVQREIEKRDVTKNSYFLNHLDMCRYASIDLHVFQFCTY